VVGGTIATSLFIRNQIGVSMTTCEKLVVNVDLQTMSYNDNDDDDDDDDDDDNDDDESLKLVSYDRVRSYAFVHVLYFHISHIFLARSLTNV